MSRPPPSPPALAAHRPGKDCPCCGVSSVARPPAWAVWPLVIGFGVLAVLLLSSIVEWLWP